MANALEYLLTEHVLKHCGGGADEEQVLVATLQVIIPLPSCTCRPCPSAPHD